MKKTKATPAFVLCQRREDPWPRRHGIPLDEGFCAICGAVVLFDPALAKEIARKYPKYEIRRICLECGAERADEMPELDLKTTADYLKRRLGN